MAALAAAVVVVIASSAAPAGAVPRPFRLTSPAFREGGTIPDGFTCIGANASPPLRWRNVPKGAVQLALTMDDPDARSGAGFVHWLLWGLDPDARSLPEETIPAGVTEGNNGAGRPGYTGPCPPPGDTPHHYRFVLYALDQRITLAPGASIDDLRGAMKGHILKQARLVGRFGR